jgi:hypothetical protein
VVLAARGTRDLDTGPEPQPPECVEPARTTARRIRLAASALAGAATALTWSL